MVPENVVSDAVEMSLGNAVSARSAAGGLAVFKGTGRICSLPTGTSAASHATPTQSSSAVFRFSKIFLLGLNGRDAAGVATSGMTSSDPPASRSSRRSSCISSSASRSAFSVGAVERAMHTSSSGVLDILSLLLTCVKNVSFSKGSRESSSRTRRRLSVGRRGFWGSGK